MKKEMKKYISIIAVLFAAGISGCKKDYLDLEVNPNSPSVSTPSLTLSAALVTSASIVQADYPFYGVWDGYWTTSGSYVPSQTINEFQFTNTDFNGSWNDLPYSQAFQPSTILFPAYDDAETIYHSLGKSLDAAIALIVANPNATSPGSADVVFAGNMTNWVLFANSIKLRLAIHVYTKLGASDPLVTDLSSTAKYGYLNQSAEADLNPGYSNTLAGSGVYQANPFWAAYGTDVNGNLTFGNVYYKANEYAIKVLQSFNDPRDSSYYTTLSPGVVVGNVFGDTKTTLSGANTSNIGTGLLISPSQNAILFSSAESLFLQAEALNDGLAISGASTTPATAQIAFQDGIAGSFADVGLTSAAAATYYGQPLANVNWTASPNKELAIITQKWISLNGLFNLEAYNEYRRTGYPALPESIDPSAISATLPTRIFYPLSELASNSTQLAKVGTINPFTSKIFWAK